MDFGIFRKIWPTPEKRELGRLNRAIDQLNFSIIENDTHAFGHLGDKEAGGQVGRAENLAPQIASDVATREQLQNLRTLLRRKITSDPTAGLSDEETQELERLRERLKGDY